MNKSIRVVARKLHSLCISERDILYMILNLNALIHLLVNFMVNLTSRSLSKNVMFL